jgi:hypothetical protein
MRTELHGLLQGERNFYVFRTSEETCLYTSTACYGDSFSFKFFA